MDLLQTLNWRYAVKKYSDRKVSDADITTIIDATNLSASSVGIQPYRLFLLDDKNLRKQLAEGSFNTQIEQASHLLVFAAFENITQEVLDEFLQRMSENGSHPQERIDYYRSAMENGLMRRDPKENFDWAARQAYIALGTAMIAAADLKIDSTPMEGFDSGKLDTLLGLKEKGLKSVVLLAVGYRDEEKDDFARVKKMRLPKEKFVTVV